MSFLERALELAERGRGTTQPNPVVGAVLVRDGEVVGEGWHERKGEAHAEVNAIAAAGDRARGSTLYVTLEPCAHVGSTPPCAQAVIDAGVAKVVVGTRDPSPNAAGGLEELREAGIETELAEIKGQVNVGKAGLEKAREVLDQAAASLITAVSRIKTQARSCAGCGTAQSSRQFTLELVWSKASNTRSPSGCSSHARTVRRLSALVARTGFEPVVSALRGQCPGPLDERAGVTPF